jgi:hypothetical protein
MKPNVKRPDAISVIQFPTESSRQLGYVLHALDSTRPEGAKDLTSTICRKAPF